MIITLWRKFREFKKPPPKYRLRPIEDGMYFLDRYCSLLGYTAVGVAKNKEEADEMIKSRERDIIYHREE